MDNQHQNKQEEQEKTLLLAYENEVLRGLLEAVTDNAEKNIAITIKRSGKTYFVFRVHGLTEDKYDACRRKATKYQKNNALGVKLPEETNTTRYRSLVIYEATLEEDREKLWDNKEAWRQLNVVNGADIIDKVLLAGEKEAVLLKVDELSGYQTELEETAKNS